jgi:hypothetical protein
MCVIIGEEIEIRVANTSIFARINSMLEQVLVYSMQVFTDKPSALVLPIPIEQGLGEKALSFIDLSGYRTFFDDLHQACQPIITDLEASADCGSIETDIMTTLKVHSVGDYEASFVPSRNGFSRLDNRFQLDGDLWDAMPDYSDYGFAVFQLKSSTAKDIYHEGKMVHPMAFIFKTRNPDNVFFPTVHVHDRFFHQKAYFDHSLYTQLPDKALSRLSYLDRMIHSPFNLINQREKEIIELNSPYIRASANPAKNHMDIKKANGVIESEQLLYGLDVHGFYTNQDFWL